MRHLLILSLFVLTSTLPAFSQDDTTYQYYNKEWKECSKDTAFYYGTTYRQGDLWSRKDYWVKGNVMQMEATYLDKNCKTRQGTVKWYDENGKLSSSGDYEKGERKNSDFYYESGKKKGHITYTANGSEQKGWTESGEEIPGYIAEKEAEFPGGVKGWKAYLEQNLNADVASKSKPGTYPVKVQFIVDKEGNISNVQTIEVPAGCSPCGKEALRIIRNGPHWEPAMQNNKPVIYQAIQYVTFQVSKE